MRSPEVRSARRSVPVAMAAVFASLTAAVATVALAAVALAASPSPTAATGGDPRSSGQGPGLVGDPLAAIVVVAAIALASLVATLAYVRLTGGPRGSQTRR